MPADEPYFRAIPWCEHLMRDGGYEIVTPDCRIPKDTTEDELLARTFNSNDTIRRWIGLFKKPEGNVTSIDEVLYLLTVGPGLNGYPHILHGGIVATILDEVMGFLITINKGLAAGEVRQPTMTAYLNVSYQKPVATPQTVLAKANLVEVTGRKRRATAEILDATGTSLARGEAIFVAVQSRL